MDFSHTFIGFLLERPDLMMRLTFKIDFCEMHTLHFETYKPADFHSNVLVSWELVNEGYQGRSVKFARVRDRDPGYFATCGFCLSFTPFS